MKVWVYRGLSGNICTFENELSEQQRGNWAFLGTQEIELEQPKKEVKKTVDMEKYGLRAFMPTGSYAVPPDAYDFELHFKVRE